MIILTVICAVSVTLIILIPVFCYKEIKHYIDYLRRPDHISDLSFGDYRAYRRMQEEVLKNRRREGEHHQHRKLAERVENDLAVGKFYYREKEK